MNWGLWRFIPGKLLVHFFTLLKNKNTLVKELTMVPYCFFLWSIHRSEEVVAVASMNYDPIVSRVAEVLGSGKTIKKRDVE